jgi:hypothetical protein
MRMSRPGGLGAGPHVFFDLDWPAVCHTKGGNDGNHVRWDLSPAGEREAISIVTYLPVCLQGLILHEYLFKGLVVLACRERFSLTNRGSEGIVYV